MHSQLLQQLPEMNKYKRVYKRLVLVYANRKIGRRKTKGLKAQPGIALKCSDFSRFFLRSWRTSCDAITPRIQQYMCS